MKDGGPAFPMGYHPEGNSADQCGGLTIRDYFAAKAMQALLSNPGLKFSKAMEPYAKDSYDMADAMLKERDAVGGG